MQETDLYAPVKSLLTAQGYEVKAEIQDCDLVAVRGQDAPVIVELKLRASLSLLLQAVDRLAITDAVYIAFPAAKTTRFRDMLRLCRRLGLGVITVRIGARTSSAEVHADPVPYHPRKVLARKSALLLEFSRRVGDPNTGGQTRRPVITAYRQDALRIAALLAQTGNGKPAEVRRALDISRAASILQKDHYGWFRRVSRGVYGLSPKGGAALELYADVLDTLTVRAAPV